MYLVVRDDENYAENPLIQAGEYAKMTQFKDILVTDSSLEKKPRNALIIGCENPDLYAHINTIHRLKHIDVLNAKTEAFGGLESKKLKIVEEAADDYDFILEIQSLQAQEGFFQKVDSVLNPGGSYVSVMFIYHEPTLKKNLLTFMLKGYTIRIKTIRTGSIVLPIIILEISKPGIVLNDLEEVVPAERTKVLRVELPGDNYYLDLMETVKRLQKFMLTNSYSFDKIVPGRRISYEVYNPKISKERPEYLLHFYDSDDPAYNKNDTYVCFIVPEGSEEFSLYRTKEGNKRLSDTMKTSRTAIATYIPGNVAKTMKEIQSDLESIIVERKPLTLCGGSIPFLTDGDYYSIRKVLHKDEDIIVEDYLGKGGVECYRRLLFVNNYRRVQTEIRLKDIPDTGEVPRDQIIWGLHPVMENKTVTKAVETLDSATQRTLFTGLKVFIGEAKKTAILGLGAGLLGDFAKVNIPGLDLTEVEISEKVVKAAKEFFFLKRNEGEIVIQDGAEYIKTVPEGSLNSLVVDIDNVVLKRGHRDILPEVKFRAEEFIKNASKALNPDNGFMCFTILQRSGDNIEEFVNSFKTGFKTILKAKALSDDQTIYIGFKSAITFADLKQNTIAGFKSIEQHFSAEDLEENEFESIVKQFQVVHIEGAEGPFGALLE